MKLSYILAALAWVALISCDDDDPVIPNESELITTLTLNLSANGETKQLIFRDLDGDGGTAPTFTTDMLDANTTYSGEVVLLNETETPADPIHEEVEEEGAEHQLFFNIQGANATAAYNDMDVNGDPIGLAFTLTTGSVSTGTLTVTLRHEPDKDGAGVADGNITNAGGETDIEVTFNLEIK